MQLNRLGTTDSTQKKIIVSDPPGPSYKQKTDGLVWRKPNRQFFADISGPRTQIKSFFFALNPWFLAGSVAYYKPYVFEAFKFDKFSL